MKINKTEFTKLFYRVRKRDCDIPVKEGGVLFPDGVTHNSLSAFQKRLDDLFNTHEVVGQWFLFSQWRKFENSTLFVWQRSNIGFGDFIEIYGFIPKDKLFEMRYGGRK